MEGSANEVSPPAHNQLHPHSQSELLYRSVLRSAQAVAAAGHQHLPDFTRAADLYCLACSMLTRLSPTLVLTYLSLYDPANGFTISLHILIHICIKVRVYAFHIARHHRFRFVICQLTASPPRPIDHAHILSPYRIIQCPTCSPNPWLV